MFIKAKDKYIIEEQLIITLTIIKVKKKYI